VLEQIHKLIKQDTIPPQSVIDLLKSTLIGTEGTLYQLLDTETKIHQLHHPHFVYLEPIRKAIVSMTMCERTVLINDPPNPTLYIRYFAFHQIFQGGTKNNGGNSSLHTYLKALFKTSNHNPVTPQNDQSIYWAFIDPQNLRSFNMNKRFGFESIGRFKTTAFSRSRPNPKKVERLKHKDEKLVVKAIQKFYTGFQFFSTTHLFKSNNYFVIREKGKIVCGIQANPVHWRIKSLPGISGKFLLKFAPFIPGIRKVINPKNHRFLATEGLFWEPEYAHKVSDLLEGVLALTGHNSLLIWTDSENEMLAKLNLKWGLLQRIKKDNEIHIVAKFNHYDVSEINHIKAAPKYLSGFDMT